MKKVLIQDRFASIEHIESLKDLMTVRVNPELAEIDFAFCLGEFKDRILDYDLIISHPHTDDDCCVPLIENAHQNEIKVVLFYKTERPHGKEIEALAQNHNLYEDVI